MAVIREPYGYTYREESRLKEVYGGPTGQVFVECMRIRPEEGTSTSVILFSHPIGGGSFLPLVTALARAGRHVIYCNTRYRGNDSALILEKCVLGPRGLYCRSEDAVRLRDCGLGRMVGRGIAIALLPGPSGASDHY